LFNDFTDFSGVVVGAAGSVLDRRFIHKPICQPNEKITNDLVESKLRKKSEEIIQTAKAPAKKLEETDIVAKVEKNFEKFSKSSLINKLPNPDDSIENLKKNSEENKDSKDKEGFGNLFGFGSNESSKSEGNLKTATQSEESEAPEEQSSWFSNIIGGKSEEQNKDNTEAEKCMKEKKSIANKQLIKDTDEKSNDESESASWFSGLLGGSSIGESKAESTKTAEESDKASKKSLAQSTEDKCKDESEPTAKRKNDCSKTTEELRKISKEASVQKSENANESSGWFSGLWEQSNEPTTDDTKVVPKTKESSKSSNKLSVHNTEEKSQDERETSSWFSGLLGQGNEQQTEDKTKAVKITEESCKGAKKSDEKTEEKRKDENESGSWFSNLWGEQSADDVKVDSKKKESSSVSQKSTAKEVETNDETENSNWFSGLWGGQSSVITADKTKADTEEVKKLPAIKEDAKEEPKGWLDGLFVQGNKELDDTKSDNWGLSGLIWSKDNNPEVEGWIGLYYYKGKRLTCDEIVARIAKDDAKSCITTDDRQKICDLAKFVQNSNLKQSRDQIMKTFGVLSAEEILSKK